MNEYIPYGHQDISQDDVDSVLTVLTSDWLTQGPMVPRFEEAVSEYCGARFGVAVSNATAALHIACLALDVGPGDFVWTSPITFVASANCARYCGATVDFVDIDPESYNLSVDALAEKLRLAESRGTLPKVVIPVHMCGQPCDMEAINALSHRYGFKIIEDASHAIGGRYRNERIGSCGYSDITVFSFHPVKIVTTGEGGMALTNDPALARRLARLRSHGITRDTSEMVGIPDGPWYYEQIELGYNYRMTDIQAALGLSQMSRLDEFVTRRHAIAGRYDEALVDLPVVAPSRRADSYSALHLYVIRLKLDGVAKSRREVFEALRQKGIGVNVHYMPVYRHPDYAQAGCEAKEYPQAERYYAEALSLPIFPTLDESGQERVISALRGALAA